MNKKTFPLLLATAMVLGACSNDTLESGNVEVVDDSNKTKIAFNVSDKGAAIASKELTRAGFASSTQIVARFVSLQKVSPSGTVFTRTVMTADADGGNEISNVSYSTTDQTRYWDDCFGRDAQLSVYAVAIPGKSNVKNGGSADANLLENLLDYTGTEHAKNWKSGTENNNINWVVSADQSTKATSIDSEDLCYSNNIKDGGTAGRYPLGDTEATKQDGQLIFTLNDDLKPEGPGKFDKGHMEFKHGLTRVIVNLKEGTGYDGNVSTTADFNFTNGGNVTFKNANIKGTLNIKEGTWSIAGDGVGDITKSSVESTKSTFNHTLMAQMLPGKTLTKDNTDNFLEFVIDNNPYFVTEAQVLKALDGKDGIVQSGDGEWTASYGLKQGYIYSFDITVNKLGIDAITASIVDWNTIEGQYTIDNAPISLNIKGNTVNYCNSFNLYRLKEVATTFTPDFSTFGSAWTTGWTTANTDMISSGTPEVLYRKSATDSDPNYNIWATNWFYENNKTYYHFRTTNQDVSKTSGITTDGGGDYFTIQSGATTYDPHWGAPYKHDATMKYSTTEGWAGSISKAIGPSQGQLNLLEHHMMADVEVIVETKDDASKVELGNGEGDNKCIVKLINFYNQAHVLMGNGLVNGHSDLKNASAGQAFIAPTTYLGSKSGYITTNSYAYRFVPQSLDRHTGADTDDEYVGIVIQTPDNNQYYIVKKLCTIPAATVSNPSSSNQAVSSAINYWYPGHKYVYTITISKKGIEAITCSLVDWTTVTGNVGDITLEN